VNLAVHFIRAKSSLILSCSSGPFAFYTLLVEVVEGRRELWMRGERGENWSVFNNWENGFPFIL